MQIDEDQTSEPPLIGRTDAELIEYLKECRGNQRETLRWLWTALTIIRDMPTPEQDNVISARMRTVASRSLEISGVGNVKDD